MIRTIFWGTRGSLTTPGPTTPRYGGNTSCVELVALPNDRPGYLRGTATPNLLLDGGTGIIEQIADQQARKPEDGTHIMLSHYHWDHIMGLPFYAPIHNPQSNIHLYGASAAGTQTSIEKLFTSVYSPLKGAQNVGGSLSYYGIGDGTISVNGFAVRTAPTAHATPALSFRIEHGGHSVVYTPDHEAGTSSIDHGLVELARDADLWILNGHFDKEEKENYAGWGHSSHLEAVELALQAKVKTLAIFHHNPDHDDAKLDAMYVEALAMAADSNTEIIMSRDGMVVDIK